MSPETILTLAIGGINTIAVLYLAYRKAPYEAKSLSADAEMDFAEAGDKRTQSLTKLLDLYEVTFQKLLSRDSQIIELTAEVKTMKVEREHDHRHLESALKEREAEHLL